MLIAAIYSNLNSRYYLSPESPSGLKYVASRGRCKKDSNAGRMESSGYYQVRLAKDKCIQAHRAVAILAKLPNWELLTTENRTWIVDHIDRDKLNNSINNLRVINYRANKINSTKSELPPGVIKFDDHYKVQAYALGKIYDLGYFNTREEASKAYRYFINSTRSIY